MAHPLDHIAAEVGFPLDLFLAWLGVFKVALLRQASGRSIPPSPPSHASPRPPRLAWRWSPNATMRGAAGGRCARLGREAAAAEAAVGSGRPCRGAGGWTARHTRRERSNGGRRRRARGGRQGVMRQAAAEVARVMLDRGRTSSLLGFLRP